MTLQANVEVEKSADWRKYVVGARLRFTAYNPAEIASVDASTFDEGDVLIVDPRNGCGMGIDVTRERDGRRDMVWHEEVELVAA